MVVDEYDNYVIIYETNFDPRAEKFLGRLDNKKRSKVFEYILLFEEYGFGLGRKYLKKIANNLWELRPKKVRLFVARVSRSCVVIHAMYKKSQKITERTVKLLKRRMEDYL